MLSLPFRDHSFDLVCSFSVIEHLDTNLPDLSYVPYPEQKRRAAVALDEMVRVTKPGGLIYLTSDCCDYERASVDHWQGGYYFKVDSDSSEARPKFSSAWPVEAVPQIFYEHLLLRGCELVGSNTYRPADLDGSENASTFRGPFFSAFSVLATRVS